MSKVHEVLLKHGRIDQKQYDALTAKETAKTQAKEKYKKDKAKLNKSEMQAIIDKLID